MMADLNDLATATLDVNDETLQEKEVDLDIDWDVVNRFQEVILEHFATTSPIQVLCAMEILARVGKEALGITELNLS